MASNGHVGMSQSQALEVFRLLAGIGYGVSIKHLRGNYYVEIPVRLKGDKAYYKEAEIMTLVQRAGFQAVQAGQLLRIA